MFLNANKKLRATTERMRLNNNIILMRHRWSGFTLLASDSIELHRHTAVYTVKHQTMHQRTTGWEKMFARHIADTVVI
jgi:hypothetical protein